MKAAYQQSAEKQREIGEFAYAAHSWDIPRCVVTRLEYGAQGVDPRFILSNLSASDYSAQALYDGLYFQRGEAENPDQGDTTGFVRRARQLPAFQGQSVSHSPTP